MADDDISYGDALFTFEALGVSASVSLALGIWVFHAHRTGRLRRAWRWLRVQALGGVTTLEDSLGYDCAKCQRSLDAHEKVRKLSCGHVFHCGTTADKCGGEPIDKWLLREQQSMTCPACGKTPRPVMPWAARPAAPPAVEMSALPLSSEISWEDAERLL